MPNSERNTSAIAPLAALKRGFSKKCMSSIGWLECSSHIRNVTRRTRADHEAGDDLGEPQPVPGASMIAHSSTPSAHDRQHRADRVELRVRRVLGLGDRKKPRTSPAITIGTLTMKIDPHQKCSRRKPPVIGTESEPDRGDAGPDADRLPALAGR